MSNAPTTSDIKRLRAAKRGSLVALSPAILDAAGLASGDRVRLEGARGRIVVTSHDAAPPEDQARAKPRAVPLDDSLTHRTRAAGRACLEQFRFALEVLGQERGLAAFRRGAE
jgi:anaerobic selenocysteine-containing dehydrogenase